MVDTSTAHEALESAFSVSSQSLIHELYFKSSHFRGAAGSLTRADHDRMLARVRGRGWLPRDTDPITALLTEISARVHGGVDAAAVPVTVGQWERAESTVNARLRAVCDLCGPMLTARVFESILPCCSGLPPLATVHLRDYFPGKRVDSLYGQPDMLLAGSGTLVTLEMKVRGARASACYDADQFFKYLRLAVDARARPGGPKRTYHVLTAPLDGGRVVKQKGGWLRAPLADGQPLTINPLALSTNLRPTRTAWLERQGGCAWLEASIGANPSSFIELSSLIDVFSEFAAQSQNADAIEQQLARCRHFGLPARSSVPTVSRAPA